MKKEARLLNERAINSLVLAIEHFNRPSDRGRIEAVLIFLDHSFEMLLKAAILHKGGRIREKGAKQTIGFEACVRKGLTDAAVKFLTPEQALNLQSINGLRDAAQHHIVDLSEGQLYLHAQAGLTLFRDLQKAVFQSDLKVELPERVLPLATTPPLNIEALFDNEVDTVRKLLKPQTRRKIDAHAKLRGLAILQGAIGGEYSQPSTGELDKICEKLQGGEDWRKIFPGVASLNISSSGVGPEINLRFTKKEGVPISVVKEGEGDGLPVAIRRVNELDFYNLGLRQLAAHLKLTPPMTLAVVRRLKLQGDLEFFKEFKILSVTHKRYSQKALEKIKAELPKLNLQEVWKKYGVARR